MSNPITRYYDEDDKKHILEIEYFDEDGKTHHDTKPAFTAFFKNGAVMMESWAKHGELHRENGPAQKRYTIDGILDSERYARNGKVHRIDGPAFTSHYRHGGALVYYFLEGVEYTEEEYWELDAVKQYKISKECNEYIKEMMDE